MTVVNREIPMQQLWLLSVSCLFALTPFALTGCGHEASVASEDRAPELTRVTVTSPVRRTVHYVVEQPGRIEPFEQTPIYAKIPGYVRTVAVEIGDRVKRGDLLVELNVPEVVEAHHAKEALVTQARLGVNQSERSVDVIQASLATGQAELEVTTAAREKTRAAVKRWESECQRMEQLTRDKVVDAESRDEVRNQCRSAQAADKEAEARIRGADAALVEARARLAKAKADLAAARNQLLVSEADERESLALLGYSRLVAPFDGVISDRQVHTGHFLNAANGSTTGQPLLVVVRIDKVRVFAEVPEADAVRVAAGEAGRIRVQTLNDREFVGKVTGTSWSLDPTQRTLRTEIDFPNPDGSLRPGMYCHSLIDVEHADAWEIPASAVLVRDETTFCYEVVDGKTHRLPLRLGLRDGNRVEVLKIQLRPRTPGDAPRWVNPTGQETIVTTKPDERLDNQVVRASRG
jgi:HlyD family secretion protein